MLEAPAEDRHEVVEVRRVEVGLELGGALEWLEEEVEASREGQRELDDTLSCREDLVSEAKGELTS